MTLSLPLFNCGDYTNNMPANGTGSLGSSNRFAGTFYIETKYNIYSVQGLTDASGESYASSDSLGIDNGAKNLITVVEDTTNKNGYTVTGLTDIFGFFRLNNATVVKVNLEAVGEVLTGNFKLAAGTQEDIISGSLVLFVFDKNSSTDELDVIYAYVYKVGQVEGAAPAEATLTISHDDDVGGPSGMFQPNADGTYSFYVTVNNGDKVALDFGNCTAEQPNLERVTDSQYRYEIIVKNITADAYVHVYGQTTITVGVPDNAEDSDYSGGTGGGELGNTDMTEDLYENELGITVDDDPQNIVITINSSKFNKASAAKQAELAKENFGGNASGLTKGAAGYVGVTVKVNGSSITGDTIRGGTFVFDGKLYPEVSENDDATSEDVYVTVADWNGSKMVLRDGTTHTVRYTANTANKVITVTINVVVK